PAGDEGADLGPGAVGDHAAAVHDHHTGGLALGLLEVVGGEDDGPPGGGYAPHLVPEGAPGADVHADGGLVQQQHLRVAEQGDGEADPLRLAAGEGAHLPLHQVGDVG